MHAFRILRSTPKMDDEKVFQASQSPRSEICESIDFDEHKPVSLINPSIHPIDTQTQR